MTAFAASNEPMQNAVVSTCHTTGGCAWVGNALNAASLAVHRRSNASFVGCGDSVRRSCGSAMRSAMFCGKMRFVGSQSTPTGARLTAAATATAQCATETYAPVACGRLLPAMRICGGVMPVVSAKNPLRVAMQSTPVCAEVLPRPGTRQSALRVSRLPSSRHLQSRQCLRNILL